MKARARLSGALRGIGVLAASVALLLGTSEPAAAYRTTPPSNPCDYAGMTDYYQTMIGIALGSGDVSAAVTYQNQQSSWFAWYQTTCVTSGGGSGGGSGGSSGGSTGGSTGGSSGGSTGGSSGGSTGGSSGGSSAAVSGGAASPTLLYPYCSEFSQPKASGRQVSDTQAQFTWPADPRESEYLISTSTYQNGAWSAWTDWTSVGAAASTTVAIAPGQTIALGVIGRCYSDAPAPLYPAGAAYVEHRALGYVPTKVPVGWACSGNDSPEMDAAYCKYSKAVPSKSAKRVSTAARASLFDQGVTPRAALSVSNVKVGAGRNARVRVTVTAVFAKPPGTYPEGRWTDRPTT